MIGLFMKVYGVRGLGLGVKVGDRPQGSLSPDKAEGIRNANGTSCSGGKRMNKVLQSEASAR